MKQFLFFTVLFLLCLNLAEVQAQTYASVPEPKNVLVVYKLPDPNNEADTLSRAVMRYYQTARGIPAVNIVALDSLVEKQITINGITHPVIIAQNGDIIQDSITATYWQGATRHAWKYFIDNVANPIRQHLINYNLQNNIRYIVLCKGVPFKIQAGGDWGALPGNLTVDGLLCMLNTDNYDALLDSLFFNFIRKADSVTHHSPPIIINPYFNADKDFSLNHRFLANRYVTQWENFNVQLSYLVSHLDGINYQTVVDIIDRSKNADTSGTATWVLDDDDGMPRYDHSSFFLDAKNKLEALDFNVNWNNDGKWITHNDGLVIGYSSWGTHANDDTCTILIDSNWVKDSLQYFQFAAGAVFNSLESFNGNSIGTLKWRWIAPAQCPPPNLKNRTQGLATQFTTHGGTGTMGHAWEPFQTGVIYNNIFMPAYAIGYNYVDAVYMGMKYLAWQNVIIGDPLTRILPAQITKILTQDSTITSGDFYGKIIVPEGITLTVQSGDTVNFKRNASLQISGNLEISSTAVLNFYGYSNLKFNTANVEITHGTFNFYNNSYLTASNLCIGSGEHLHFNNKSFFNTDSLTIAAGAVLAFNDNSSLQIKHKLYAVGTEAQKIIINSNNSTSFIKISDANSVELSNAIVNGAILEAFITTFYNAKINVNKAAFNNLIIIYGPELQTQNSELNIKDVTINGAAPEGLHIMNVMDVNLENIIVSGVGNPYAGIWIDNCSNVSISGCNISNFTNGILYGWDLSHYLDSMLFITNNIINDCFTGVYVYCFTGELLQISNNNMNGLVNSENNDTKGVLIGQSKAANISDCIISNFDYGISYKRDSRTAENPLLSGNLVIENNQINNCIEGIYFNDFQTIFPIIKKNIITSPKPVSENEKTSAVILINGSEAAIESNTIYDYDFGIQLSQVANPYIASNKIQILDDRGSIESGIFSNSSDGIHRLNLITGYKKGIELGNSSPKIGQNVITDNKAAGLYVSSGSIPDLSEGMIKREETAKVFPISGLNQIFENGGAYDELYPYDGAEIHMFDADILLGYGCNTIADDRVEQPGLKTRILLFSEKTRNSIRANYNYWGNHPVYGNDPSYRIESDVEVNFEPYNNEPCTKQRDGEFVLIKDSKNTVVIDTIYSLGLTVSADSTSESYALAAKHFFDDNFNEAKQVYYNIVQAYSNNRKSLEAYTKLYTISKLTDTLTSTFADLKSFYDNKLQSIQDTLMLKIVKHLSDLCLIAKKDYAQAINNFGEVILQNPNSEEAFFAAVDILTTSLLDTTNTALSKVGGIDLSAKDASDYRTKLNALIKARNNKQSLFVSKVIPTEYYLYQNYPNPFNPTTKIQYDIPTDTKVELKIYDILGREIKTLVNEFQMAGRYSVEFDASRLASGVYIYRISAKNFISAKKLILIR